MIISTIKKTFLYYSSLLLLVFANVSAQTGEWINSGPPGEIFDIAVNPIDSSEMFVSVSRSGLFKSTDCGRTWKFSAKGIPVGEDYFHYKYRVVKYNPVDPRIIFAGTGTNETGCGMSVFKSTDAGNNRERAGVDSIPGSASILTIEINPLNPNRMYLSAIYCNAYGGIYRSDDAGTTWQKILPLTAAGPVLIDSKDTSIVYVVDRHGTFFKSTNGGDTWEEHSNDSVYNVESIIKSEATGEFFFKSYSGIYKSTDGINIIPINNNLPGGVISFSYDSSSIFIAAGESGVYMSTDQGVTWVNKFNGIYTRTIEVLRDSVLIGTSSGLFSSADNGDTWNYVGGCGSSYVTSIANTNSDSDKLYASTYAGVFKSEDRGFTWEPAGHMGKYVQEIATNPVDPDIIYASRTGWFGDGGLYKSIDGGKSWYKISSKSVLDIEIQNSEPNVILAGSGEILKSTDYGETWNSLYVISGASEIEPTGAYQVKVAPNNPDFIYSYFSGYYQYRGIHISTDGGKTWKRKVNGFPTSVEGPGEFPIAIHPNNPHVAYIGNSTGEVYKTTNTGDSWVKVYGGLPEYRDLDVTSITILKDKPSIIYVTYSGEWNTAEVRGIYRSTDNGMTWKKHSTEGMYNTLITCLLFNSSGYAEELYAGTIYGGIFKYYDDSALPVELNSFTASYTGNMKVEIVWSTESEKNNLGFSIERRSRNNLSWNEIGYVEGKGTTTEKSNYYFEDHITVPGYYFYRLKQTDMDGSTKYFAEKEVQVYQVSDFSLEQNYPNPFNPQTTIKFNLPEDGFVTLKLYDASGAEISILINEYRQAGEYSLNLSSKDLASGVYIYKIDINTSTGKKYSSARKLTVLK